MVQPEKRLLWHPRQDNKFIVGGGSQITLYEWAPDHPEIRQVTSQHGLQHLKCFAWSPDPIFNDLIAVGNTNGKIELLRLEASKYSQRTNVLTSGQGVPLQVRNSRACNSLAFCTADPHYLASGFDKVRGDCSLVIWDVNTASAMLSAPLDQPTTHLTSQRPHPAIPQGDVGRGADPRILQQHAPTETVSTVCFLPQSTHLLLAGISHRWLRLFDFRNPIPSITSIASKVQGIATDPFDPHRIACFGEGTITVWDTRRLSVPTLSFTERDAAADGAYLRSNIIHTGVEFSSTRRGTLASLEKDAVYVRFWDVMCAHPHVFDEAHTDGGKLKDSARAGRRSWANLPWQSSQAQHSPKEIEMQSSVVLGDTRKTKDFTRPLASFTLAPSPHQHPLTSNVMVVNKEGDLELYAVYDTPKHAIWSARGDLIIAAGLSCRVLEGAREPASDEPDQPLSGPHSHSRSGEDSVSRGRQKPKTGPVIPPPPPPPPLFGRGDEEGFPALGVGLTNPPITRSDKGGESTSMRKGRGEATEHPGGLGVMEMVSRNHSSSRVRRAGGSKGVGLVVENDISMTIKKRAAKGYGLSDPQHNMYIARDYDPSHGTQLADLWAWISHSHEYFSIPTSVLHGYDFAYQGLLGIWEGFQPLPIAQQPDPTPQNLYSGAHLYHRAARHANAPVDEQYGNFQAALGALASQRIGDKSWKPKIATAKGLQRQIALQLCGWSLKEEGLTNTLPKWEQDGEFSRVACWLVFTKQYTKAIALLMKSPDEAHRMMSGTIAALITHSASSKSTELREHCERLIVRLQDPYFRAMLTHLALNDWSEVLEEEALPFRERLAIAFQFLDDNAVTSYLRRCTDRACTRGDVEGIIIPGLSSKSGLDILQGYVDHTGDVQSAAILGSYVCPPRNVGRLGSSSMERRVGRWVEGYRDLLDGFKMFHGRVGFDIERGQVALGRVGGAPGGGVMGDWVPTQIIIRCNYCNKPVSPNGPGLMEAEARGGQQSGRPTACYHCNRALPRCSICLMTLSIIQDAAREAELLHSQLKETIDDAIVMCQTCRHGGHVAHILDWFYGQDGGPSHEVCAVADCDCRCTEEV